MMEIKKKQDVETGNVKHALSENTPLTSKNGNCVEDVKIVNEIETTAEDTKPVDKEEIKYIDENEEVANKNQQN